MMKINSVIILDLVYESWNYE